MTQNERLLSQIDAQRAVEQQRVANDTKRIEQVEAPQAKAQADLAAAARLALEKAAGVSREEAGGDGDEAASGGISAQEPSTGTEGRKQPPS